MAGIEMIKVMFRRGRKLFYLVNKYTVCVVHGFCVR